MTDTAPSRRAEAAPRPNIVFILADDLGYADASCYGAPQIRTPAIDRLAAEGVRLTQAYANSAVCTGSRAALMTGCYQQRWAVGLEEPLRASAKVGLPPDVPTFPEQLRVAGYDTWLIGKWHLGQLPDYGPHLSGYRHFWGFRGGALDYFSHTAFGRPDLWEGLEAVSVDGYLTDLIGARAVDVVRGRRRGAAPFLLSVHFSAPHWPWEGPEDAAESQRLAGRMRNHDRGTLATYNRMVEAMDHQIAELLRALEETGQADDTLVVFTSDNGGERFSNTWPFNGRKAELLEGGLRVPCVIRWPRALRPGQVRHQMLMHMDWAPTLLAAAGIPETDRPRFDGIELLQVLAGASPERDRQLFWRHKAHAQRAAREGPYKALKIGGHAWLFDVVADPMERADLRRSKPDIFERLTGAWDEWNAQMLPATAEAFTYANTGDRWPDRIGVSRVGLDDVDRDARWPPLRKSRRGR